MLKWSPSYRKLKSLSDGSLLVRLVNFSVCVEEELQVHVKRKRSRMISDRQIGDVSNEFLFWLTVENLLFSLPSQEYKPYMFWMNMIDAFYQSLVCFFIPYFVSPV